MKKTYLKPVLTEVVIKNTLTILTGSIETDNTPGNIIDGDDTV